MIKLVAKKYLQNGKEYATFQQNFSDSRYMFVKAFELEKEGWAICYENDKKGVIH